ncbi:MAG: FtsX-like permease family protein [Coriobacteriales bacterium]|nr:FtsX-like permease family protein [Coriobacteriales bacterium]
MKKTQLIELFCNIKATFVSFFSIIMFVALGVGIFLGLGWSADAVRTNAEAALKQGNFEHFNITFPVGLTQEDVEAISALDGIDDFEMGFSSSVSFHLRNTGHSGIIRSLTKNINQAQVLEGKLPKAANEIAVDSVFAYSYGIKVGDTLVMDHDSAADPDGMQYLYTESYEVTAIVTHPAYVSSDSITRGISTTGSGSAEFFMLIIPEAFDASAFGDACTDVYVRSNSLEGYDWTDQTYIDTSEKILASINKLGSTRSQARIEELTSQLQSLMDIYNPYLDSAQKAVEKGTSLSTYVDLTQKALSEVSTNIQNAVDAYEDGRSSRLLSTDMRVKIQAGLLAAKEAGIDTSVLGDYSNPDKLEEAMLDGSLLKALSTCDTQLNKLAYLAQEAGDNKDAQLAAIKTVRQEATSTIDTLKSVENLSWTTTGRSQNLSLLTVDAFKQVTGNLRFTMASLFLIVGLLVCYTAISRIVREQITSIGTKKALGLRRSEITLSYLLYSFFAVLAGVIIGATAGVWIVEFITNSAVDSSFVFGQLDPYFSLTDTLAIGAVELITIWASTLIACYSVLKKHAVQLLKGPEPPKAKARFYEKWAIWQRLPLYTQSIVNNLFNDKVRVFGSLVGIAGCTALVVTAMTIDLNVSDTFTVQYRDIYHYTSIVQLDPDVKDAQENMEATLAAANVPYAPMMRKTMGLYLPDGSVTAATVEAPSAAGKPTDDFLTLFSLNVTEAAPDALNGTNADLSYEGIWLSEALRAHQGVKVGDTVRIVSLTGEQCEIKVAGFFEYHLKDNKAVLGAAAYESLFGTAPQANCFVVDVSQTDESALTKSIVKTSGYYSYWNDKTSQGARFASYQSLTRTVVLVYLALSALMAFLVLLNLNVMFIEEKKRDLIVLMINGFSLRDAKRYIYRDNIVLTIIGIILGVLLGMLMGYLSILSIEFSTDSYVHSPNLIACLAGVASSTILAIIVNIIALRRIDKFRLTDINKM